MNYRWRSPYAGFGYSLTRTVKTLIVINVAVFLLVRLFPGPPWLSLFGLVPRYVFGRLMLWQLVSYMFLHAGLFHLAVNMLMLWFFGPALESAWGRKEFLKFYFITGIGAGISSFTVSFRSPVPVIGASGAIFGVLVAYAMMYPENIILLFFIFPMKMKHAVLFLAGVNLLGAITNPHGGIAYCAHLGGALAGYLYLKSEWLRWRLSRFSLSNLRQYLEKERRRRQEIFQKELDQKVDRILDKISRHGMKSLSRKEKEILEQKSKRR